MRNINETLKKILELAERGSDGEREVAERMLSELCEKHGVSIDELMTDRTERVTYKFKGEYERRLLWQIVFMVLDSNTVKYRKGRGAITIDITKIQRISIDQYFSVYKKALKEHIEASYLAFIEVNEIFPATLPDTSSNSSLDAKRLLKIYRLMLGIKKINVHKQLVGDCK